jgi:ParB family transcriptional regulator, chromosome partitioning protein
MGSMKIDLSANKAENPSNAFMQMMGFGQESGKDGTITLPISSLRPYPKQKTFRNYSEEKFSDLVENIRSVGVLEPVIVRPLENNTYQILAGHTRAAAAKSAGLTEIPCVIKNVDDAEADIIFVATNLNQRDKLLPSERAYAYKLLMEATAGHKTAESIAQQENENRRQVFRYLRLTYLLPEILEMVDDDKLPMMAGVNISYLSENSQQFVLDYITKNRLKVRLSHSEALKEAASDSELTATQLDYIFAQNNRQEKKTLKLPMNEVRGYFAGIDDDEISQKILEIIKEHFAKRQ